MKKLFTLIAFLTCFLGAKAGEVIVDKTVDYSTYNGFPFYVMGYVPEWIDGVMTDFGANYRYATQADLDGDGDAKWKDGETSEATVKTNNGTATTVPFYLRPKICAIHKRKKTRTATNTPIP